MKASFEATICLAALSFLVVVWSPVVLAETRRFTAETGLERLWDISRMPELRPEKLRMTSSGAVYPEAKDGAEFLYRDSNGEYVLFDAAGPGCLVRYWSALIVEGTRIRFYFDGHTEPDIDMPLIDMFTGERFPWTQPVVGNDEISSGGFYSYLPIPYEKGCKVTLDRLPSFYHLESLSLPDYDEVETFDLDMAERYRAAIETANERLKSVGYPASASEGTATAATIKPGDALALADLKGPGVIDIVTLKVEPDDPDTLREVLIRAFWDEETSPSVWSPLGDFFVSGHVKTEFNSLPLGSTPKGFYCRFPMPFKRSALLELVNESDKDITVEYGVSHRSTDSFPDDWGMFHARWSRVETQMGEYVTLLNARGRGKFVGVSFNPQSISPWMLEGDEVVWADGELMPSVHGTGTEDYFSGAWYFKNGPFDLPTHGAPLLELNRGGLTTRVSLYRFHTLDPFSFSERIRVCIEHGQERSMQGSDYCFTSFWYQTEPHVAPFPMPPAAERLAEAAPVVAYFKRFHEWGKPVNEKDDDKAVELGIKLIDEFPNAANLNLVRYRTGQALRRLGRVDEAVEVWRSAQDYWGIDFNETALCATEAWVHGGQKGDPPKALLAVKRLDRPQKPGAFDSDVWNALPVATNFHPHFPNAYMDLPADVQTEAQMAYDDEYIYVRAKCWEPEPDKLVTSELAPQRFNLKEDSLVVLFDARRSYNEFLFVSVNINGEVQATSTNRAIAVWYARQDMDLDLGAEAAASIEDDSWTVELRIPRKSLGLDGSVGDKISGLQLIRARNAGQEKPEVTMWGSGMIPIAPAQFSLARFE